MSPLPVIHNWLNIINVMRQKNGRNIKKSLLFKIETKKKSAGVSSSC
jgi:hypothetical protein